MRYKKFFFAVNVFCLHVLTVSAQDQKIADSLSIIYQQNTLTDTAKFELLTDLSFNELKNLKKGLAYAEELIALAQKFGNSKYLRTGYFLKGTKSRMMGELEQALGAYFKSAEIATAEHNLKAEGQSYSAIADIYSVGNNHTTAVNYYNKAIHALRQTNDSIHLASALSNAGDEFLKAKKYDTALLYLEEAKLIFDKTNYTTGKAYSLGNIGMVYASIGKNTLAEKNMNEAISILEKAGDYYPICVYLTSIADIYLSKGDHHTALNYTMRSLQLADQHGLKEQVSDACIKLSGIYERAGNFAEAFKYYKKHISYRDSLSNITTVQKMADLRTDYEVSQKQAKINLQKNATISLAVILGLTIIIIGILLKHTRQRRSAYQVLNLQRLATEEQKSKAENTLAELQSAQKQLIHSAKMASLGEVTAGIAHEIQNPLNFVNNFSEMSVDLLNELKEGAFSKLSGADKAEANDIINSLTSNLSKINDHGKRADGIVKGMLQHTRGGTGKKELTDINTLAGECLRLSYHGFKAMDKDFDVSFTSDFDKSIGKINIVPQEIARLLLNLYNNAFYSVNLKKKQAANGFEPGVLVTTKKIAGNKIEISVKDNGVGISSNVVDKIFQPFFTTKPTGQGTGLGLSLSYDIVKAHEGELKVQSTEGEFAEFIIQLNSAPDLASASVSV